MTPFVATLLISLLAATSVALVGALLWWHPISAQVKRRVDTLVRGTSPSGANAAAAFVPGRGLNLVIRFFTLGMPRKWGVNTGPLTLLLLGLVAGSIAGLVCGLVFGLAPAITLPLILVALWMAPNTLARLEQGRADKRFVEIFPEAVDMIVRMLRASLPMSKAIRTVAEEAPEPISSVFASIADQIDIGISFEDALRIASEKIALPDFRFFSAAVTLQHSTGGNLVSTLEILADIVRRRRAVRMKARATTAEVRMSAYVLATLPFIVIGALEMVNPTYMAVLISDPRGNVILLLTGLLLLMAFLTMRYMMRRVTHV